MWRQEVPDTKLQSRAPGNWVTDILNNCRNLKRLLLCMASLLFLLLAMPPASAGDSELCDKAGADPEAGIPACTRLLEHPSAETKIPAVYNNRGVAKVRKGNLDDAIADFTSAIDHDSRFVAARS
jgi:hypothetical protein